ncbi:peptidylprolyl isomerase [Candidatus Heimdallarchaeota archaeon]|nr:MAG: peptidylprolyl isomerase [Candidatus Gerdarchaeota archaeon]RLI73245.1 MAG: peptidylprolyl isomerase [Candidatus Heimdallarchaeota archaeon]
MTIAILETSKGTIELELFDEETPNTVKNFVSLIQQGFYDGLTFHRVIDEFVIQGGCPNGTGTGGPGYRIPCETSAAKQFHKVGALSMAHAGPNTGGSQFFIVLNEGNCKHLNGKHTVFGQTIAGLDVVKKIQKGDKIIKATVKDVSEKIANWQLKKM